MPLHRVTRPPADDREVIVCVSDRARFARIRDGLPTTTIVRWCPTTAQLARMLDTAGTRLRMIVVEPRDQGGSPTAPIVREARRRRPDVAIVGYCRPGHEDSRNIIDLAAAGIHELVFRDTTDFGIVLQQTLSQADRSCGASQALERLQSLIPLELRPLVEYCLYFPHLSTSVHAVAAALGVHRKTLVNTCRRAGFPAPSALIAWLRLAIVAHLLETQGGVVERIALALDYPSATALRNTLRRYAGYRPAELRHGGLARILDAFASLLTADTSARSPVPRRAS
jgi:AraC-like DNA-binding protein